MLFPKSITTKTFALSALFSALVLSTTVQAQTFHKWVDKDGSTHYTLTPPPPHAKPVGKVPTYSDKPSQQNVNTSQTTPSNNDEQSRQYADRVAAAAEAAAAAASESVTPPVPAASANREQTVKPNAYGRIPAQ